MVDIDVFLEDITHYDFANVWDKCLQKLYDSHACLAEMRAMVQKVDPCPM